MARVRSPEEIRRQREFINNTTERARARDVHAARDDEAKRPVSLSSSLALEQRQREEDLHREKAIDAAIIRANRQSSTSPIIEIKSAVLAAPTQFQRREDKLQDRIAIIDDQFPHELI